jgi:hypothetical protein
MKDPLHVKPETDSFKSVIIPAQDFSFKEVNRKIVWERQRMILQQDEG